MYTPEELSRIRSLEKYQDPKTETDERDHAQAELASIAWLHGLRLQPAPGTRPDASGNVRVIREDGQDKLLLTLTQTSDLSQEACVLSQEEARTLETTLRSGHAYVGGGSVRFSPLGAVSLRGLTAHLDLAELLATLRVFVAGYLGSH